MRGEQIPRGNDKRIIEEKIIIKILRLLAEDQLISLEEELRGKELLERNQGND